MSSKEEKYMFSEKIVKDPFAERIFSIEHKPCVLKFDFEKKMHRASATFKQFASLNV